MNNNYYNKIHRIGRLSGIIVLLLIFIVPITICMFYDIFPPIKNLLLGIGMVCMIYLPVSIAEFLTYTPMLGSNASYLVFVTGNLTNLKIPCALMCMDNAKVKAQTDEGEVIAAIAVASCSIVTIIIVFIGMLAIIPLQPVLNSPSLQPAFQNIIPALFGALGAYWISKQWKLAIVPIVCVAIAFNVFPFLIDFAGALIPIMGVISIIAARIMYNKKFITQFNER